MAAIFQAIQAKVESIREFRGLHKIDENEKFYVVPYFVKYSWKLKSVNFYWKYNQIFLYISWISTPVPNSPENEKHKRKLVNNKIK